MKIYTFEFVFQTPDGKDDATRFCASDFNEAYDLFHDFLIQDEQYTVDEALGIQFQTEVVYDSDDEEIYRQDYGLPSVYYSNVKPKHFRITGRIALDSPLDYNRDCVWSYCAMDVMDAQDNVIPVAFEAFYANIEEPNVLSVTWELPDYSVAPFMENITNNTLADGIRLADVEHFKDTAFTCESMDEKKTHKITDILELNVEWESWLGWQQKSMLQNQSVRDRNIR